MFKKIGQYVSITITSSSLYRFILKPVAHMILVLISLPSIKGSGEQLQMHRLTRAFAAGPGILICWYTQRIDEDKDTGQYLDL